MDDQALRPIAYNDSISYSPEDVFNGNIALSNLLSELESLYSELNAIDGKDLPSAHLLKKVSGDVKLSVGTVNSMYQKINNLKVSFQENFPEIQLLFSEMQKELIIAETYLEPIHNNPQPRNSLRPVYYEQQPEPLNPSPVPLEQTSNSPSPILFNLGASGEPILYQPHEGVAQAEFYLNNTGGLALLDEFGNWKNGAKALYLRTLELYYKGMYVNIPEYVTEYLNEEYERLDKEKTNRNENTEQILKEIIDAANELDSNEGVLFSNEEIIRTTYEYAPEVVEITSEALLAIYTGGLSLTNSTKVELMIDIAASTLLELPEEIGSEYTARENIDETIVNSMVQITYDELIEYFIGKGFDELELAVMIANSSIPELASLLTP